MSQPVELEYEALCRALESIPEYRRCTKQPTDAQLRALLKYWPTRRSREEIARMLGVGVKLARKWYKEAATEFDRAY